MVYASYWLSLPGVTTCSWGKLTFSSSIYWGTGVFTAPDPELFSIYISEAQLLDVVKMSFGKPMQACTTIIWLHINNNLAKRPRIQCLVLSWGQRASVTHLGW